MDMMFCSFLVVKALLLQGCPSLMSKTAFKVGAYTFVPNCNKLEGEGFKVLWARDATRNATLEAWTSGKVKLMAPKVEEFDTTDFQLRFQKLLK